MILRCLIQDDRQLALDCCKAFLRKGSQVEVDDKYWREGEIQNAIRMGFLQLVGPAPGSSSSDGPSMTEKTVSYQNTYSLRLAFDCVKKSVDPGKMIAVPISKVESPEIRNAIAAGWLLDVENPAATPSPSMGTPVALEELTVKDIVSEPQQRLSQISVLQQPVQPTVAVQKPQYSYPKPPAMQRPVEKTASAQPSPLRDIVSQINQQINQVQPSWRNAPQMNIRLDQPVLEKRPPPPPSKDGSKPHKKAIKALHISEAEADDLYGKPTQVVDPGIRQRPVLAPLAGPQSKTIDIEGHAAVPLGDTTMDDLTEEERLLQQIQTHKYSNGLPSMATAIPMTASMRAAPATVAAVPCKRELFSFANIFGEKASG